MLVACFISLLGIFMVEYLTWTPVGADTVGCVQGRYLIPVAPLLFFAVACLPSFRYEKLCVTFIGLTSVLATLWTTYNFFY